jgi:hypothetical protein
LARSRPPRQKTVEQLGPSTREAAGASCGGEGRDEASHCAPVATLAATAGPAQRRLRPRRSTVDWVEG